MFTILYVPFAPSEDTNLMDAAIYWETQSPEQKIFIVRHQEDEIELPEDEMFQVYILGHGICDLQFIEENKLFQHICAKPVGGKILAIEEVAARFQQDFLYYKSNIRSIKLYFCNLTDTNEYIADKFQQNLLDSCKSIKIYHYEGELFAPEMGKHKYSKDKNGVYLRSSKRRSFLYNVEESLNNKYEHRISLFKPVSFECNKEKRSKMLTDKRREKRDQYMHARRFEP